MQQNEYVVKITPNGRSLGIKRYILARGKTEQEVKKRLELCKCTVHEVVRTINKMPKLSYNSTLSPIQKGRIDNRNKKRKV